MVTMKAVSQFKFRQLAVGMLAVTSIGVACGGEGIEADDFSFDETNSSGEIGEIGEIGTLEQALCENNGGTNAVMTAIAVAAGRELRRWKPETDFTWNTSTGRLALSTTGAARCGSTTTTTSCMDTWITTNSTCAQQKSWGNCNASWMGTQCEATCGQCTSSTTTGGSCKNLQALLDMQKPEANGVVKFPGNIVLDVALLKSSLKSAWDSQMSCNASGSCNVPAHDLRFDHVEDGSCDKKYFFDPLKEGTSTFLSSTSASTLSNKLKFVGYPSNKMLNFYLRDGKVSVDPTYGLNEGATSTSGSCDVACSKFSTSDLTGKCCSCNGATLKYARSAFNANTYLCK
jgi:hypothetical protein